MLRSAATIATCSPAHRRRPVVGRRASLKHPDALGIDLVQRSTGPRCRRRDPLRSRSRRPPVAAAIARQHLQVDLAPALETVRSGSCPRGRPGHTTTSGSFLPFTAMKSSSSMANLSLAMLGGARAEDDRQAVGLALPFEPRGEVHRVAQHRIVEAQVRSHVADDALAGVEADADLQRNERRAAVARPRLALAVERVDARRACPAPPRRR